MEPSYILTRAQIVEAFRRWDAAAVDGEWPETHDIEGKADAFLKYAGEAEQD